MVVKTAIYVEMTELLPTVDVLYFINITSKNMYDIHPHRYFEHIPINQQTTQACEITQECAELDRPIHNRRPSHNTPLTPFGTSLDTMESPNGPVSGILWVSPFVDSGGVIPIEPLRDIAWPLIA